MFPKNAKGTQLYIIMYALVDNTRGFISGEGGIIRGGLSMGFYAMSV